MCRDRVHEPGFRWENKAVARGRVCSRTCLVGQLEAGKAWKQQISVGTGTSSVEWVHFQVWSWCCKRGGEESAEGRVKKKQSWQSLCAQGRIFHFSIKGGTVFLTHDERKRSGGLLETVTGGGVTQEITSDVCVPVRHESAEILIRVRHSKVFSAVRWLWHWAAVTLGCPCSGGSSAEARRHLWKKGLHKRISTSGGSAQALLQIRLKLSAILAKHRHWEMASADEAYICVYTDIYTYICIFIHIYISVYIFSTTVISIPNTDREQDRPGCRWLEILCAITIRARFKK